MDECIFCMIARGQIPARIVYSNDDVVAFDDIAPQGPVHTLVIPRDHYVSMNDAPPEVLCALFSAVPEVARIKGIADSGYRVIVNNGPDASQTVCHLHAHVLGGGHMAHGMVHFA